MASIELAMENLFLWPKIKTSVGNGNHDFTSHDLSFHVSVSVVLSSVVVEVDVAGGVEGDEFFELLLVVVDENGGVTLNASLDTKINPKVQSCRRQAVAALGRGYFPPVQTTDPSFNEMK